jgi:hypothetical protein
MKSFTRACLIFSGVVIAIGLILTIIGGILGAGSTFASMVKDGPFSVTWGKHHTFYASDDLTTNSFEFNNIDELNIDLKYGELSIVKSDGNSIKVEADNVLDGFACKEDDGELVIKDNIKGNLKIGFNDDYHPVVTLYIPENTVFDDVDIDMGAGYVNSSDLSTDKLVIDLGAGEYEGSNIIAKDAKLSVGAGHLSINDFVTDTIDLDCGTGKMEIYGEIQGDAKIDCGIGNIVLSLTNSQSEYNYKIDCGIGNVTVGEQSFGGIATEKKINNNADNNMDIDCGVGGVEINFDKSI